MLRVKIFWL